MSSFSPAGITDIANMALLEVGQQPIDDIDSTNGEAPAVCRAAFWPAVTQVGRAHNWSCLKLRKRLVQLSLPQNSSCYSNSGTAIGWPGCYPSVPPPYWLPNTLYAGGALVTYGEAIYYCLAPMGPQVSSNNFINDMTNGQWAQLYSTMPPAGWGNAGGLYEWAYGYAIPSDYLLLNELNGIDCRQGRNEGDLYEMYVTQITNGDQTLSSARALFCNKHYADVKYTALIQDPTIWDALFIDAVVVLLASKISTQIRGDDGKLAAELRNKYKNDVLPLAKMKDAGEGKPRRYDPTEASNFLKSRYGSTAG